MTTPPTPTDALVIIADIVGTCWHAMGVPQKDAQRLVDTVGRLQAKQDGTSSPLDLVAAATARIRRAVVELGRAIVPEHDTVQGDRIRRAMHRAQAIAGQLEDLSRQIEDLSRQA